MSNVRLMEERDISRLVEMGAQAHAESEYRLINYDREKATSLCRRALVGNGVVCLVCCRDEAILGVLVAEAYEPYFSHERVASDLFVYVLPEHRGGRAFVLLVWSYIGWAKRISAKLIFLRTSTGIKPKQTSDLYRRLGFAEIGGIYRMEV